jgi:hypothetical protein
MDKRVRLTARKAADGSIPYPGNVNQPGRTDPAADKYDNFEQKVNHELPDMRTDWKGDSRDEIGFGIPEAWGKNPTTASVKVAANKAVKLAYLLLGEKVEEEVIEAQARDFMMLGPVAIDRSLTRFAKTQSLYAKSEETEEGEEKTAAKGEVPEAFKKNWDKGDDKKDEKKDDKAEKDAKKAAEDADAAEKAKKAAEEAEKAEKAEKEAKKAAEEADKAEKAKKAAEEADKAEKEAKKAAEEEEVSASKKGFDVELSSSMDGELDASEDEDGRIAGLFDDNIPSELPMPGAGRKGSEASEKKGVKRLGGQPRVASEGVGSDIGSIWDAPPDVSELFR